MKKKDKKLCDTFQNFVNLQLISFTGLNTTLYMYVCNIIKTILFDSIFKIIAGKRREGREWNSREIQFDEIVSDWTTVCRIHSVACEIWSRNWFN